MKKLITLLQTALAFTVLADPVTLETVGNVETLITASYWSNGISPTDSQSAELDYLVAKSAAIRGPSSAATFKCQSMQWGTDTVGVNVYMKEGSLTFENDGLVLVNGIMSSWSSANTVTFGGKVSVETSGSPFVITLPSDSNGDRNRTYSFTGALAATQESAVLELRNTRADGDVILSLDLKGGASAYNGSIKASAGSRVVSYGGSLPGTVDLTAADAELQVVSSQLTLGHLDCVAGARLLTWANCTDGTCGTLTCGELGMSGRLVVSVDESGTPDSARSYEILSVAGGDFTEEDFSLVAPNGRFASELTLRVSNEGGVCKLYADRKAVVYRSDSSSGSLTWEQGAAWRDGNPPHGDVDYYVGQYKDLRPGNLSVFPAANITLEAGAYLILMQPTTVISNLNIKAKDGKDVAFYNWHNYNADRTVNPFAEDGTKWYRGRIAANANLVFKQTVHGYIDFGADVAGAGDIIIEQQMAGDPSAPCRAYLELSGDNSAFAGRIVCGGLDAAPFAADYGNAMYLYVSEAKNVGRAGATTPDYQHLNLKNRSVLRTKSESVVIEDQMNGIRISGSVAFESQDGQTMTIKSPMTYAGCLYKKGSGLLALGGPAPHFGEGDELPPATGDSGNNVVVSEGGLKPLSTNAFQNLQVTFMGMSKLYADLPGSASDDVAVYGLYPTGASPLTVDTADGMLHVAIDADPELISDSVTFPILTVPTAVASTLRGKITIDKPKRGLAGKVVEKTIDAGTVTFCGEISKQGFVLLFR